MLCPICKSALTKDSPKPFCSAQCRTIDLAQWLDGSYRISSPVTDDEVLENESAKPSLDEDPS